MKKIILGLVLGLLFSFTFANADMVAKNITVHYDTVKKIMINGEEKTPVDKKPFVYEGTTYVPLRYISEALGEKVKWDGKTGIVYIGEIPKTKYTPTEGETYLTDKKIDYYSDVYLYRIDNSTSKSLNMDKDAGVDYPKDFKMTLMVDPITEKIKQYEKGMSIKGYDDRSRLVYKLDGKYHKLSGLIGIDNNLNKGMDEGYTIKFLVDRDVKQEIELKKNKYPAHIDIDVSNGKKLEIEFVCPKGNKGEPFINLVDMVLE